MNKSVRERMIDNEPEDPILIEDDPVEEAQIGGVGYNQDRADMYVRKMQDFVKKFGINEFFDLIADNLSPRAFDDGVRRWLHPFASNMRVAESRRAMLRESEELADENARKMKAFADKYGVDALIKVVAPSTVDQYQDMFNFENALAETMKPDYGPARENCAEDIAAMADEFDLDEDVLYSYISTSGVSKYMNFIYGVEEDEYDEIEYAYVDYNGEIGIVQVDVDGLEKDEDCKAEGVTFDKVLAYYKSHYDVIGVYDGIEEGRRKFDSKDILIAGERRDGAVVTERHASGRAERRAVKVKKDGERKNRQR